jgi:3-dehydroquinate dehydratase II
MRFQFGKCFFCVPNNGRTNRACLLTQPLHREGNPAMALSTTPHADAMVFVLNGPNLNLLGKREPHLYGSETLADVEARCRRVAATLNLQIDFRQTNHEGVMVDWVQEAREHGAAIVINPAGLSFRSIPLLDALKTIDAPLAEVHITNIHQRDALYQKSLVSLAAKGVICGFGPLGYELALRAVADQLARAPG